MSETPHWFGSSEGRRKPVLHEEVPGDQTDDMVTGAAFNKALADTSDDFDYNLPEPGDEMVGESELQEQRSKLLAEVDQFIALLNNDRKPRSDEISLFLEIKYRWNDESVKEELLKNLRDLRSKIDPSLNQVNMNQLTKLRRQLRNITRFGIEAPKTE